MPHPVSERCTAGLLYIALQDLKSHQNVMVLGSHLGNASAAALLEEKGMDQGAVQQHLIPEEEDWLSGQLDKAAQQAGVPLQVSYTAVHPARFAREFVWCHGPATDTCHM